MDREIVETVQQILKQLYTLNPPPQGINKIVRETIFYLYEGGDTAKSSFERPHSAEARALHRKARAQRVRFNGKNFLVVYDHAIPWDTLISVLRDAAALQEKMSDFLIRYVLGVVIHKDEDAKLSKSGLRCQLPPGEPAYDMLARYRKVEIKSSPRMRPN